MYWWEWALARYKHVDYGQMRLVPVSFAYQILPGSFEYTLSCLIDQALDLAAFEYAFGVMTWARRPMRPPCCSRVCYWPTAKG